MGSAIAAAAQAQSKEVATRERLFTSVTRPPGEQDDHTPNHSEPNPEFHVCQDTCQRDDTEKVCGCSGESSHD